MPLPTQVRFGRPALRSSRRPGPRSIALVANGNEPFYRLRMPWVRLLREHHYDVYAVTPGGPWNGLIEAAGARLVEWTLSRSGRNPFAELGALMELVRILRRLRPDVVQNFHTKPNIYAPMAAAMAGVRVSVSTVTGLGYTFVDRPGTRRRPARRLNLALYRIANHLASEVAFQNPDDLALLREAGTLPGAKGRLLSGGSGVDLTEYSPNARDSAAIVALRQSLGLPRDAFVAMFVGRLQLDKGVEDVVAAARAVRAKRRDVRFVVVGAPDPGNRRSVTASQLAAWKAEGSVVFTGRREDVPRLMAAANVVVAPTMYREGLPRTLLEAAATGLPLIGTDMPGVREAITEGVNGRLIPTRAPGALAAAVEELADDRGKAGRYGAASLARARLEFDHRRVIGRHLALYEELWARATGRAPATGGSRAWYAGGGRDAARG